MTVRESIVRGRVSSEHIVQFFDSTASRSECVASFLAEGYRATEPAIVVVTAAHWAGIAGQLDALGVPVDEALAEGTLVVFDAHETLGRISPGGSPDAAAFEAAIGAPVAALAGGSRVRAYGEMVDMLAQRGEMRDAIRLEALWNHLGERVAFSLMCGYSSAHFVATATHRALRDICGAHTCVHRQAQDPLASWLLNTAHNPPDAGLTN